MRTKLRPALLLGAALLLALAGWAVQAGREVEPLSLASPLHGLGRELGPWRAIGADQTIDARSLELLKPRDYLLRNYMDAQGRVCALFVAFFGMQQEGQMIHSPRQCLPGNGWQIKSRSEVSVPGPGGGWRVNHLVLGLNLDRLSVLYWYQGRDRVEANEYLDRLRLIGDALFHQRTDGALVRLTADLPPTGHDPLREQVAMAEALIPSLERLLPAGPGAGRP